MNFDLTYRLTELPLPDIEVEYSKLWRFANVLEEVGLAVESWHPAASTEKESLLENAFDGNGPTTVAIDMAKKSSLSNGTSIRALGVWNGIEGDGSAAFSESQGIDSLCSLTFQVQGVPGFMQTTRVARVVSQAVRIWPASSVQVGPFMYYSQHQVFENRPGVGWMLYLPKILTTRQVPEACDLIPVIVGEQQVGTIIVSVVDRSFSATNPEHVRVANAIERRLSDQGLLPLFTEL